MANPSACGRKQALSKWRRVETIFDFKVRPEPFKLSGGHRHKSEKQIVKPAGSRKSRIE